VVGVAEFSCDRREGSAGLFAHDVSGILQSSASDDGGRWQADVSVCHALQGTQRHRESHGSLGGGVRAALTDQHLRHRVRVPNDGREAACTGVEPSSEDVDGFLMSVACTTHRRDDLRVKIGSAERLLGIDQRARIRGQRVHRRGSQECAHRPATTSQHPFTHSRCRANERHPAWLDDEVQCRITDDRLTRDDAWFEVPLREPEPLHQFFGRLRGREAVERREPRREQHPSRLVEHSYRVDELT